MKKVMHYGSMFVAMLFVAIIAASCSNSNPVAKYVDYINDATAELKNISTPEEAAQYENKFDGIEVDTDYVLTDTDKKDIVKAYKKFVEAMMDKAVEVSGGALDKDMVEAMQDAIVEQIKTAVDNAETLGEADANLERVLNQLM